MMEVIKKVTDNWPMHDDYSYRNIIDQVKDYGVISFDIYDTLIKRLVYDRREVFYKVAIDFNSQSDLHIDPFSFTNARIKAGSIAITRIKEKGEKEVTLNQIYNCLPEEYYGSRFQLMQIEESVEVKCTRRNEEIFKVYDWCCKNNKKIIFTSDMYLSQEIIEHILHKMGYDSYYKLFVSSAFGRKKEDGELFQIIIKDLNVKSSEIIHIGDNYYSDYLMAKKNGIKSVCISTIPYRTRFTSIRKIPDSHRKEWIKLKQIMNHYIDRDRGDDYCYGYEILGPILYGFSKWVHEDAKKKNVHTIYFLSRDGGIIQKAYNCLYKEEAINNVYLYASRRTLFTPQLWIDNTIKNFASQFRYNVPWNFYKLANWLGLGDDCLKFWIESGFEIEESVNTDKLLVDKRFVDFYSKIQDLVTHNSKDEFDTYTTYLNAMGFKDNVAIVDIGWKGRMQKNLEVIMKQQQKNISMHGYYIGLYDVVSPELDMQGFIPNVLESVDSVGEIFEYLFTSVNEGSTKRIQLIEGKYRPELLKYEYENRIEQKTLSEIQGGAVDFIDTLRNCITDIDLSGEIAVENLKASGKYPSKTMISLFENVTFGDNPDYSMIIYQGMKKYFRSPKQLVIDWSNSGWHVGFAKKLIKIPFPYYRLCRFLKRK